MGMWSCAGDGPQGETERHEGGGGMLWLWADFWYGFRGYAGSADCDQMLCTMQGTAS